MFCVSFYIEVYICFNRYVIISNKNIKYNKISIKYLMPGIIVFSTLLFVPTYFSMELEYNSTYELYVVVFNNIGKSKIMISFSLFVVLIELVIPLILTTILNTMNVTEYRNRIKEKMTLNASFHKNLSKKEIKFTRITMSITFIYILSHTCDLAGAISYRLVIGWNLNPLEELNSIIIFFRTFTMFILFFQHSYNSIIYLIFDKNIKTEFKKIISKYK